MLHIQGNPNMPFHFHPLLFLWRLVRLTVAIVLIVKFWRACQAMDEMNRTTRLMAGDLKDLRDKAGADKIARQEQNPGSPNPL